MREVQMLWTLCHCMVH